jgi:hypothetical protein
VDNLEDQNLDGPSHAEKVERLLELGRLLDLMELLWLRELAAVDARGAAGAEQGQRAASTAAWLSDRLHMDADTAADSVRIARALFPNP